MWQLSRGGRRTFLHPSLLRACCSQQDLCIILSKLACDSWKETLLVSEHQKPSVIRFHYIQEKADISAAISLNPDGLLAPQLRGKMTFLEFGVNYPFKEIDLPSPSLFLPFPNGRHSPNTWTNSITPFKLTEHPSLWQKKKSCSSAQGTTTISCMLIFCLQQQNEFKKKTPTDIG